MLEFGMRPVGHECNAIVILESLRPDERNTAESLERTLHARAGTDKRWRGLFIRRQHIGSSAELATEMQMMRNTCIDGEPFPMRPMLHFEVHGDEHGVRLEPSGDLVPWRGIYEALVEVNRATRGQLQVSLGVCFGAHIIDIINPPAPAPFWGALAPTESVIGLTIEGFFAEYFDALLESLEGPTAIQRARDSFAGGVPAFQYFSGREIFYGAYTRLLARVMTTDGLDDLVDRALQGRDPHDPHAHLDIGRRLRAKDQVMPLLEKEFYRDRDEFFMTGCDEGGGHLSGVEWADVLEGALALGRMT